jgi:amino acid permease
MVIIIILYVGMGLFGYLRFGSDVLGSITLNLPENDMWVGEFHVTSLPYKRLFASYRKAQMVQGMLAFAIFISHGLACYVAIDIIWNEHLSRKVTSSKRFWEYITRTLLVFVTCELINFSMKKQLSDLNEYSTPHRQSYLLLPFQTSSCSFRCSVLSVCPPWVSPFQLW